MNLALPATILTQVLCALILVQLVTCTPRPIYPIRDAQGAIHGFSRQPTGEPPLPILYQ